MPKRTHDGELIAETDTHVDTGRLGRLIEQRLPEIDLPELLIEVDGWTGFTDYLAPLRGNRSRSPDMPCVLYAALIAQATNLGLTGMARASDFSYQQLEWAWERIARLIPGRALASSMLDSPIRAPGQDLHLRSQRPCQARPSSPTARWSSRPAAAASSAAPAPFVLVSNMSGVLRSRPQGSLIPRW
jgi:hypothetical protein